MRTNPGGACYSKKAYISAVQFSLHTAQAARVYCVNFQWPTSAFIWTAHLGFLFVEIWVQRTASAGWDFTSVCAQNPAVLLFSFSWQHTATGSLGRAEKWLSLA